MWRYLLYLFFRWLAIKRQPRQHFFVETWDETFWEEKLHDLADRVPEDYIQIILIIGMYCVKEGIEGWIQKVCELHTFIGRFYRATTMQRRNMATLHGYTALLNCMQVGAGLCLFCIILSIIKIDNIQTGLATYGLVLLYMAVSLLLFLFQ